MLCLKLMEEVASNERHIISTVGIDNQYYPFAWNSIKFESVHTSTLAISSSTNTCMNNYNFFKT